MKEKSIFNQKEIAVYSTLEVLTENAAELKKCLDARGKIHFSELLLKLSAIAEAKLKTKAS